MWPVNGRFIAIVLVRWGILKRVLAFNGFCVIVLILPFLYPSYSSPNNQGDKLT